MLAEDLDRVQKGVEELVAADSETRRKKISSVETLLDSLEEKFKQRKECMSGPIPVP